jgi:5'-nucleotidase
MSNNIRPTILITNDDGYQAQGINVLANILKDLGNIIIVAPDSARSGAACSITPTQPVTIQKINDNTYACSGTPVDCVKIALEKILPCKPDLVVSGINHGDNASISLHYSGTVGATLEACMKGIPAIAYSLRTHKKECNFSPYTQVIEVWAKKVLAEGLPSDTCLNINFPEVPKLAGTSICRMARGQWHTEWLEAGTDNDGRNIYTLTGTFVNLEPDASDTDYWALDHDMASITPLHLDMTDQATLESLRRANKDQ